MAILDFKEIPEAYIGDGEQDTFELFARDFLEYLGYKIISQPSRGADGGADLIVEEVRTGIAGETKIRWLASCKHLAHSGKSVTPSIEPSILDRVQSKNCAGFIGFYSTIPSSSLSQRLEGLKPKIEFQVFDAKEIEKRLLGSVEGVKLAERYFSTSIKGWRKNNPNPVQLFSDTNSLKCMNCGADLLVNKNGVIVVWSKNYSVPFEGDFSENKNRTQITDVYWCCKGNCDDKLRNIYARMYPNHVDSWEDIPDISIPTVYLRWVLVTINELHDIERYFYTREAIDRIKTMLIELFPYVARDLTDNEEKQIQNLMMIPRFLGGLGE